MKKLVNGLKFFWLPLFVGVFYVYAQNEPSNRFGPRLAAQFADGVKVYNEARYDQAKDVFNRIVSLGPQNKLFTAALLMQARSDLNLGNNSAAHKNLQRLIDLPQPSRYKEHAHFLLGQIAFAEEDFSEAAGEFIWILDFGNTQPLKNDAQSYAEILFDDYLNPSDLRRKLRRDYIGENGLALIALKLARHELEQGKHAAGARIVDDFIKVHPRTIFRKQLEEWDQIPERPANAILRIGVVLPLSGLDEKEGRSLLAGIRYAERNFKLNKADLSLTASRATSATFKTNQSRVEFVVRDSESSIIGSIRAAQSLLSDPAIVAMIGEYDGAASSALAALAQERSVPLIVPVATENSIASLGDFVFQLNADRDRKGRAIAEYAFSYLNCRTFISIAPQDEYGQQMTDGLSAAVDSLGGEFFAQKWYYEGAEDLGRQFKSIREAAFRRHMADTLKLSGVFVDQSNREEFWRDLNFRFVRENPKKDNIVDELSHPVTNIDALFLPLYEEDIRIIANQRAYYNLQTIVLGGDKWQNLDRETKKDLERYIENAIIASDCFIDLKSERGRTFLNSFRTQMGVTPEKHAIFGYDAASIILSCINDGSRSPSEVRRALAQLDGYVGMKGEISLNNPSRINTKVNILQFSGGELKRIR